MQTISDTPIVANHNFILATRDTGYKDIASAIAELVDNAIEATARYVHILVREDRIEGCRELSIAVVDDGHGMSSNNLCHAIQFGGSTRFNSRVNIGRFGMGLPNSSVSQSRRLDIYSWQAHSECLHTYLDVDEIASGSLQGVPQPSPCDLPQWLHKVVSVNHGTAVIWSRCDRVDYRKAVTIRQKLARAIGQRYRYLIDTTVTILIDGIKIEPLDPLFLHNTVSTFCQASPFGDPLVFDVSLPNSSDKTRIEARFSELHIQSLTQLSNADKRELGIVGGAGVSIIRAGREIDYGWMLLGGKRRENYDDWWRCELRFEPTADELFGVTHSKQGICPTRYLKEAISPDLEGVARQLNTRVRDAFQSLRTRPVAAVEAANKMDILLPIPIPQISSNARPVNQDISYAISFDALMRPEMFTYSFNNGCIKVVINTAHPFYQTLYVPIRAISQPVADRLEAFILAAARANVIEAHPTNDRFNQAWADAFSAFVSHL